MILIGRAMTNISQTVLYLHGIVRSLISPKGASLILTLVTMCGTRSRHWRLVQRIIILRHFTRGGIAFQRRRIGPSISLTREALSSNRSSIFSNREALSSDGSAASRAVRESLSKLAFSNLCILLTSASSL